MRGGGLALRSSGSPPAVEQMTLRRHARPSHAGAQIPRLGSGQQHPAQHRRERLARSIAPSVAAIARPRRRLAAPATALLDRKRDAISGRIDPDGLAPRHADRVGMNPCASWGSPLTAGSGECRQRDDGIRPPASGPLQDRSLPSKCLALRPAKSLTEASASHGVERLRGGAPEGLQRLRSLVTSDSTPTADLPLAGPCGGEQCKLVEREQPGDIGRRREDEPAARRQMTRRIRYLQRVAIIAAAERQRPVERGQLARAGRDHQKS